jgi:hypothetical protein
MMQIHFGWILLTAAVLTIILALFLIRKRKTASKESNNQQGEIFQPYLSINKHERKEGIKHIIIRNSGKGRANHCRVENTEECHLEFKITGNSQVISGGTLKLSGHPKPGYSTSTPGKYKFILYYQDESGEEYKIIVSDEGEGNGPELKNAFL